MTLRHGWRTPLFSSVLPIVCILAMLLVGVMRLPERASAIAAPPQLIVTIGDSIVYGLHDEQNQGGWPGRLPRFLHAAFPTQEYRVVNAGVNGDTSAGVLARLKRNVIALSPNLVIVAIGTNDFDTAVPVETFRSRLHAMLLQIQQHTHAALLVQSFLPETRVSDARLKREAAYNAVVPQVCREVDAGYQDLFNAYLALGRSAMTNLRYDSEHPTAAGYRLIAAETAAIIESAYATAQGTLIAPATPPGVDDLLPDDSLNTRK